MTPYLFLMPLLPFLWAHETPFAADLLLLPLLLLLLLAWRLPGRWSVFALIYAALFLVHAGGLRTEGPGAALGTWVAILGTVIVAVLTFADGRDRRQLRQAPAFLLACLAAIPVLALLGLAIYRVTDSPLSRWSVAVALNTLMPVLALALYPVLHTNRSPVRNLLLPAMAALCVFGLVRGGVQGFSLRGQMTRVDALVANGQYAQALDASQPALELAMKKSWRPAVRQLRFRRFEAHRGLGQPIGGIREARIAGDLDPLRWVEIAQQFDEAFITGLARVPLEEDTHSGLAVDVEVSRDGQDVYVLDRLGRVYLVREDGYKRVFEAPIRFDRPGVQAADLELSDNGAGFLVLDSRGGIHVGGEPSRAVRDALASGRLASEWTVDLELGPGEAVLYVLSRYGAVRALGESPFSEAELHQHFWDDDSARALEVASNGSLIILDKFGATHWIGDRLPFADLKNVPYWPEQDMALDLEVWPGDQSWGVMDQLGAVHPVGPVQFDQGEASRYFRTFPCAVDMEIVPDTGEIVFVNGNFAILRARPVEP